MFKQTPQEVASSNSDWNLFTDPKPYVTVSGIAYDQFGNFPLLWRTDKVRSAKNCWSLPSGLHEVGLTVTEQFAVELKEELNLTAIPETSRFIGFYENIRPDPLPAKGWHWVIFVMTMQVESLERIQNKEPDKHRLQVVNIDSPWLSGNGAWAPKLGPFLQVAHEQIRSNVRNVVR